MRPDLLGPPPRREPARLYPSVQPYRESATRPRARFSWPADDDWDLPATPGQIAVLRAKARDHDTLYLAPASKGEATAMLRAEDRAQRDREKMRERLASA
jgi:hypothetical protein